jgi:opacity protein-like surface antigen
MAAAVRLHLERISFMKKTLTLLALAALASLGAPAQAQTPTVRPFLGIGLTGGGEELASFLRTDGRTDTVTSGGLVEFKAGVDWHLSGPYSLRGSVGYHVDNSTANNGSFRFDRFPFELLGFWRGGNNFRLGGGLRQATSARTSGSGLASGLDRTFSASLGLVVEAEYFFSPGLSVSGRGVSETYRLNGVDFNGNHVGVGLNFYF